MPRLEAPPVSLEPWALVPDPGWDGQGTDRLLRRAWSVNANSAWTRAYTAHWCPKRAGRISVVYYGAPVEPPPAPRDEALARDRQRSAALPWPYILCVARLAEYKGLDVLAMAFAAALPAGADARLVLCGADHSQGHLFPFLRRLGIAERVHWLGQQPHARVLELIQGCLFFALPSRRESLGGALIEAMAAGKAVVASRAGGIPELVRDELDGLLVEPKDVSALAQAMRRLLADPALRERLGRSARERSALFTWEGALDDYSDAWASHPEWKEGMAVGFAIWDSCADQTALAYQKNVARGLARRGQRVCLALWRSRWSEPFREAVQGGVLYRLGAPEKSLLAFLAPPLILLQLLWISRAEKLRVWHFLLLRYRRMRGLLWFSALSRCRPVVTLA